MFLLKLDAPATAAVDRAARSLRRRRHRGAIAGRGAGRRGARAQCSRSASRSATSISSCCGRAALSRRCACASARSIRRRRRIAALRCKRPPAARHAGATASGARASRRAPASPRRRISSSRSRCVRRSPRASNARAPSRAPAACRCSPIRVMFRGAGAARSGARRAHAHAGRQDARAPTMPNDDRAEVLESHHVHGPVPGGRRRSARRCRRSSPTTPAARSRTPRASRSSCASTSTRRSRSSRREFGILEATRGRRAAGDAAQRRSRSSAAQRTRSAGAASCASARIRRAIADWLQRVRSPRIGAASGRRGARGRAADAAGTWRETTGSTSVFAAASPTTPFTLPSPRARSRPKSSAFRSAQPGFYVVELASRRLGASLLGATTSRYVATAALVTNLAVHFKWGRESSRVWVTRLDDGEPVADAAVAIIDYCTGDERWRRRAPTRDGIAAIGESFGEPHSTDGCCSRTRIAPLIVLAHATATSASRCRAGTTASSRTTSA